MGLGEMTKQLKELAALSEKIPVKQVGWFTITNTLSSRGSGALFWSPGAPEHHVTHIHTNTHAYISERGGWDSFLFHSS